MPTRVRVRARHAFAHEGIAVEAGAWIVLPATDAAILARRGLVNLSKPHLQTRVLTPEAEPAPEQPAIRRRRYRRADLTAETP